jgi:hypothetical protein
MVHNMVDNEMMGLWNEGLEFQDTMHPYCK